MTYLLESIFRSAGRETGVIGTVSYRFPGKVLPAPNTTPESTDLQRLLREAAEGGITHLVMEVSSHALDLFRVDDCLFAAGVFTNLSHDHLDFHRNMEGLLPRQERFFEEILTGEKERRIVNGDDPWGMRLMGELREPVTVFGTGPAMEIAPLSWNLTLEGIDAVLRTPAGTFPVKSPLIGKFNLYNILAAVAAALAVGIGPPDIAEGIGALTAVPGRLEKVGGPGGPAVFVDYAHKEDALRKVLETLAVFREGRIITVFGCGGDRDRTKRPLMGKAVAETSDLSVITSDNPRTEDPLAIIAEIEGGLRAVTPRKYASERFERPSTGRGTSFCRTGGRPSPGRAMAGKRTSSSSPEKGTRTTRSSGRRSAPSTPLVAGEALAGGTAGGPCDESIPFLPLRRRDPPGDRTHPRGGEREGFVLRHLHRHEADWTGSTSSSPSPANGSTGTGFSGRPGKGRRGPSREDRQGASRGGPPGKKISSTVSVADTLRALGDLARFWRDRFPVPSSP